MVPNAGRNSEHDAAFARDYDQACLARHRPLQLATDAPEMLLACLATEA